MNILSNIPDELKQLDNWCVWKFENRNGKRTKIPFNAATGEFAKSNDKSTWSSYETAVNAKGVDGIGFFLNPHTLALILMILMMIFIDLSKVIN